MSGDGEEPNWHDQRSVVLTAGVAALVLLALLVYAVIRTSDSSTGPQTVPLAPSSATPSTYTTSSTSTTTYSVPRVQTSQDNPAITPPSVEQSTGRESDDDTTAQDPTTTNP